MSFVLVTLENVEPLGRLVVSQQRLSDHCTDHCTDSDCTVPELQQRMQIMYSYFFLQIQLLGSG